MSGFSSMFGYIVTFFLIIGLFIGGIIIYTNQITLQKSVIDSSIDKFNEINNFNLDFNLPFNNSGRISFYLENSGSDLILKKDNSYCFDLYLDNKYISKDKINLNLDNSLNGDYYGVLNGERGIFSVSLDEFDFSKTSVVKFVDCQGKFETFSINKSDLNYWDKDYLQRKEISISNPSNYPMEEYQIFFELDNSNFDFNNSLDDLRFVSSLYDNIVLDINLDDFKQILDDDSKYLNTVYLGSDLIVEGSDPVLVQGIMGNGLDFDGNDYLTILSDNSIEIPREFTFSSWVNWTETGGTKQYLYVNGDIRNSIAIINDGGVNDNKIEFNLHIDGISRTLISNSQISSDWHFVTCTFDGETMKIFIDGVEDNSQIYVGDIAIFSNDNFVGGNGAADNYNGLIDELKVFNVALTNDEVEDLYVNNLRFRLLDYYVQTTDLVNNISQIYVKIPFVNSNDDINIQMYFDKDKFNVEGSLSNIENTFTYNSPNIVSYVVSNRMASVTGLNVMSLEDNNTIIVGSNNFNQDTSEGTIIATGSINSYDEIRMKKLAQVEGNGQNDDVVTPISWAGRGFYNRGFRNGNDEFCMLSPFGTANVEIRDAGIIEWSGSVGVSGQCVTNDIGTNNALAIISDLPILVHYQGGGTQDSWPFFPAVDEDLYGIPSQNMHIGSGPSGASISWIESGGGSGNMNLGSYGSGNDGGNGADGNGPAFKVSSNNLIGVIQEADGDGSEATVFVTRNEFGTLFGSNEETDYLAIASDVSDANCTIYNSTGGIVGTQVNGVGNNGIYKYGFGTGNDNSYELGGWILKCEKPVWPYYENHVDNDDETNLWSYLQMRQYVYPEPIVVIN